MIQEPYNQIKSLFEPPAPAASATSAAFPQMGENRSTNNNEIGSNNISKDHSGTFETCSKENIGNETSYEDDSDDDSEDIPLFYSSLTTTTRTGLETPSLPLVGLVQPHGSSTPKEHAYSFSPGSPAASNTSPTLARGSAAVIFPSSPSSRQVSLPRQKAVLEPGGSLHISNLDPTAVTEAILYNHFCAIGPVSSVKICRDAETARSLGYGYVNYYKRDDARRAMEVLNFRPIANAPNNKIRIAKVFAKGQPPPVAANVVVKGLPTADDLLSSQGGGSDINGLGHALWTTFAGYGEIVSVRVVESDGRAYIQFENEDSARAVLVAANSSGGVQIDGRFVRVESFVGRETRESWSSAASNKAFQQDQPHSQSASKKNDVMLPLGLVVSSLPNVNKSDINGCDSGELTYNSSPDLAVSAAVHGNAINSSSSSATLYTSAELVQPAPSNLPSLYTNNSPNYSHQIPTHEATVAQSTTGSDFMVPKPPLLSYQMSLPFMSLPFSTHGPMISKLPPYRRHMQPPRGHGWTTVKILNLSEVVYGEDEHIESLARELCRAFGDVASVNIASANPEHFNGRAVYVRFFDARAAITARNVIAGLQLGPGRPLRAFLLTRHANAGIGKEGSASALAACVQPMIMVRHLGNQVTANDIIRALRENCPAVYNELFSASCGYTNTSNSSSSGFGSEKSLIHLYPSHYTAMITFPDRTVAIAAAAALDKIEINGSVVTACVARDFEDDDRSSPYVHKFPPRQHRSGQHWQKIQEQQQYKQEMRQFEYQSQYPPLPERPENYSYSRSQSSATELESTHVPPDQSLSQDSAHWYIRHIPRPYIYFPMLTSETRPQSVHTGTTGSSMDSTARHTKVVGHYYFGIDTSGTSYHVQHPMPPSVPAPLLLQSGLLVESSAETAEVAELEPVDKMKWENETPLKIQLDTLQEAPLKPTSNPGTSTSVVAKPAIMYRNSALPLSKTLQSTCSAAKDNSYELQSDATATKSFSPPLCTNGAEGNFSTRTRGKSNTLGIPSGPAKLHQHQQTPLVHMDQGSSGTGNSKSSKGMSNRQRRRLLGGRHRGRRANSTIPGIAACKK